MNILVVDDDDYFANKLKIDLNTHKPQVSEN